MFYLVLDSRLTRIWLWSSKGRLNVQLSKYIRNVMALPD